MAMLVDLGRQHFNEEIQRTGHTGSLSHHHSFLKSPPRPLQKNTIVGDKQVGCVEGRQMEKALHHMESVRAFDSE